MPALIAAGEKLEAGEEIHRQVVFDRTGKRIWVGPDGSGEVPAVWSPDGRLLAYAVGGDLVVHAAGRADRLAIRGVITAARPLAGFDRSGRYLAARTGAGVVVADLARGGTLMPELIDTGIHCEADDLRWRPDAGDLWALCRSESPDLYIWNLASRSLRTRDDPATTGLLGWRTRAPAGMVVRHGDAPALLGPAGEPLPLPQPPTGDLGHVVAAAGGLLVYSDVDDDDGTERTVWLARGEAEVPWPWLQGLLFGLSITDDGTWAAFVVPEDRDTEAGEVYLVRVGEHRVHPVIQHRGMMVGGPIGEGEADSEAAERDAMGEDEEEEEGEEEEDNDYRVVDEDVPEDLIGWIHPVPQPRPARGCGPRLPRAREQLAVAERIVAGEGGLMLEAGGAIVGDGEDGADQVTYGTGPVRMKLPEGWQVVRAMPGDQLLIESAAGVELRAADGRRLVELPRARLQDVAALPGGGVVRLEGTRVLHRYDGAGALVATHRASADVREILPVVGGGLLLVETGEEGELLSATGARLAGFPVREDVAAALDDGTIVTLEEDAGAEETELELVFRDRRGAQLGRAPLLAGDAGSLTLVPMSGGRVALVDDSATRIDFFGRTGRELGSFFSGVTLEQPAAALRGALVIGVDRILWLVGADGTYLGGHVLPEPVAEGPFAIADGRLVVRTESAVWVLERRKR